MEHQQIQSDGTRTRTGCLTCRIRKKKCDEGRPSCRMCLSRRLPCYGFSEPVPDWIGTKASWKQLRESDEARSLRRVAELQYRASRKVEAHLGTSAVATLLVQHDDDDRTPQSSSSQELVNLLDKQLKLQSVPYLASGVNIWQTRPESIWWDSKLQNLRPCSSYSGDTSDSLFYAFNSSSPSSREGTRLLLVYLDVIHPITHTFYKLQTSTDRSWMMSRLVETESLFCSAISISACFEHSLTQPPSIDRIGLSSKVLRLQSESIAKLRAEVDQFALMSPVPVPDFLSAGIRLLGVIAHLETLEIFSMLDGQWEMHHLAARRVLNHIELCSSSALQTSESIIATMLSASPETDLRRRSLEFSILNYVWVDVLATSTFQTTDYYPCKFDYLPLLDAKILKPQHITGCQGWVWATICRITRLEGWRKSQQSPMDNDNSQMEFWRQCRQLDQDLDVGIGRISSAERCFHNERGTPMPQDERDSEQERKRYSAQKSDLHSDNNICFECDVDLITIIWAYGAKVLLQVLIASTPPSQPSIDQTFVNLCIERLEALPIRLVMRITWPYTIAGSMASGESQQQRFRWIVGKTLQGAQAPGVSWKGLIVMEECWRLKRIRKDQLVTWREAMENLKAKVILT